MAREVLVRHGITAVACPTLDALCHHWMEGAGLLLVAEEAVFPSGYDMLARKLAEQPAWSDIPVLVFLAGAATPGSLDRLRALRNVSLLERPIRIPALISAIAAGLRARTRQYEVRNLMAELRDANRAKDDFVAMVSHELRTPLNVIRGMARMLQLQESDPARVQAAADKIDRNAAVLSRVVEDLLDLSRLQKRRFQLTVAPVDLHHVVSTAVEMNRLAAEAKGVHLTTRVEPLPSPILGDAVRLEQIVSNLLSNAIKFTPHDGTVTAYLSAAGPDAVITVVDTGEGINPELLPHVFDPFRQGDTGVRSGGLGLGLAIVREFVELHGGSILAASGGHGLGATFIVRLPLQTAATAT